jgi:hypothetical protein
VCFKNISHWPTNLAEAAFLLGFTGEVLGSNLGPATGYPEWGYPWYSRILPVSYRDNNFIWTQPLLSEP